LVQFKQLGRAVGTPRNYEGFSREGYQKNVSAFRAIKDISQAISQLEWTLTKKATTRTGQDTEILESDLLTLLRRPNPMMSGPMYFEAVIAYRLISGNTYIQSVGPSPGKVTELHLLRPDRMRVKSGQLGISGYVYRINGKDIDIPVDVVTGKSPILHWKSFNPLNDFYGQSPMEAASLDIDTSNEVKQWNFSLLRNSGMPSGALVMKPNGANATMNLTDEQYKKLKQEIQDSYSGAQNSGRPMVLEGGMEWQQMSLTPKDMDWLNSKNTTARDVAAAFGYPSMLLGIPGDNTFSNYKEARLALWEETIIPLAINLRECLNYWLVPLFGENLFLDFDRDKISALESRRQILWDRADKSNELTINERRVLKGFDEIEGGDVILVPTSVIPLEQALEEEEESNRVEDPEDDEDDEE